MRAPPPSDPTGPTSDDTEYYRRALHALIDIGVQLVEDLPVIAKSPAPPSPADLALAYERLTRAVRRTILLAQLLDEPDKRRQAARRQIIRQVEDAIYRSENDDEEQDHLEREFRDRLDGPDIADDIGLRPLDDIIADICRDLALAGPPGPWKRRTPDDIADLVARAAGPRPQPAPARPPTDTERLFLLAPAPDPEPPD